jgi:hypothetical protein
MFIEPYLQEIAQVTFRSREFLDALRDYDWRNTYTAYLNNTGCILLPFKDGNIDQFKKSNKNVTPDGMKIAYMAMPLLREIEALFPGYKFIKGEIYNSFANTEQQLHIDPRIFHRLGPRIHIPIVTNPDARLQVDTQHFHLKEFTMYQFNNVVPHRSYNHGGADRIHLVVDINVNDPCDNNIKTPEELFARFTSPENGMVSEFLSTSIL